MICVCRVACNRLIRQVLRDVVDIVGERSRPTSILPLTLISTLPYTINHCNDSDARSHPYRGAGSYLLIGPAFHESLIKIDKILNNFLDF